MRVINCAGKGIRGRKKKYFKQINSLNKRIFNNSIIKSPLNVTKEEILPEINQTRHITRTYGNNGYKKNIQVSVAEIWTQKKLRFWRNKLCPYKLSIYGGGSTF